MIGIDWVAVVVLGVAWGLSNVRAIPQNVRHWIFALACFGIAGYRLYGGAAGLNLLFVIVAAAIGVQYAIRALRTPKGQ
jgi:regulator of protease activity HflC (stomatin/prohibitin superfamily)